ncbi:Non-hem dioxygenase N-terminal domain [Arabidopsis suecica]|uniref:Non-hem dioxygenase N-terminal domain n=1 Tax=Arabidopsis suecica TaxID=45249 RepID=A0A8T2ECE9_ARASU|nr:Non-hem dioxygenase N-terminal domain [Arabidopsis suecica]
MEVKGATRSSIIVPSVQEMVKEKMITTVPPRYVRSDQDVAEIAVDSGLRNQIPIIDMSLLCSSTSMDSEIDKLDSACKEWGFFQLVNHGMESSFLNKVKSEVQDFFNLPMEEKKNLWQQPDEIEGFGQVFVVSEEQKLDWADMFFLTMQPVRLRKPHLFPKLPLPFRDTLDMYSAEVKSIAKILLGKIAVALKIKPEEMDKLFVDELGQRIRLNYYPRCPEPDKVIGLTRILILQDSPYCCRLMKLKVSKSRKMPSGFLSNLSQMLWLSMSETS